MAKSKPSRAFLEALQKDKQKRGDDRPGGGFRTPEWFFKKDPAAVSTQGPSPAPGAAPIPVATTGAFRLTWLHFAIASVFVVGAVTTLYMVTRESDAPKLALPSETVKTGMAHADVLDVNADRTGPAVPGPAPIPVGPAASANGTAGTREPTGRVIGMNYVVMQSFENDAKATEAAEALRAAGIGCTIEKNHPYAPKWILVIGTQGFAKPFTPEYEAYIKKVVQVSNRYSGSSKWKKLEPNPYRWR